MLSERNTVRHDAAYTYNDLDLQLEWFPLKIIFRNSPNWELCSLGRVQHSVPREHTVYPRSEILSRNFPLHRGPAGVGRSKTSVRVNYTNLRQI